MDLERVLPYLPDAEMQLYRNLQGWRTKKIYHDVKSKFVNPYFTEFVDRDEVKVSVQVVEIPMDDIDD